MLRFHNVETVFQEIPDEITLAINISGCPHRCDGCHSPWLWEDKGTELNEHSIDFIMLGREGYSCICFMGGDADHATINRLAKYVKDKYKMKVGWYSGNDNLSNEVDFANFDYVKIGHYDKERGPLDAPWTNQRMLKIIHGTVFEDITNAFGKKNF